MSLLAGIRANRSAKQIAKGILERGEQDAQLRRLQAEQLLGEIRSSVASRGFRLASVSAQDLEREAAFLEGVDIDRIKFRAGVEAQQVRLEGIAALTGSVADTIQTTAAALQLGFTQSKSANIQAALRQPRQILDTSRLTPSGSFGTEDQFGFTTFPGTVGA